MNLHDIVASCFQYSVFIREQKEDVNLNPGHRSLLMAITLITGH